MPSKSGVKVRQNFVSNSSSSSFIVIGNSGTYEKVHSNENDEYIFGQDGETEFGWTPQDITDIDSRINFCKIQSTYLDGKYDDVIEQVIRKNSSVQTFNNCMSPDWDYDSSQKYSYIDHQSAAIEGQNLEMFESESTLEKFIFDSGSYIHTDNDNH